MTNKNKQMALVEYAQRLGDNSLILGQRLGEWCGHGPQLELDIALTNFSLDMIGQANLYLGYAGEVEGKSRDADAMAYLRDELEFRNCLLVEQPNGDFGQTIMRHFLFSTFQHLHLEALQSSKDETLAGIAGKAIKEVAYHVKFSADWVRRLGGGTPESHQRMQTALDNLWRFTGELFETDGVDALLLAEGIAVDLSALQDPWNTAVQTVLKDAGLRLPKGQVVVSGGRKGNHSEHLGPMLAEMQFLQRAYPGLDW